MRQTSRRGSGYPSLRSLSSIAFKLAFSACWTVAVLLALSLLLRSEMTQLSAMQDQAMVSDAARGEIDTVISSAKELRTISRELPGLQTADGIQRALYRMRAEASAARRCLEAVSQRALTSASRPFITRSAAALSELVAALEREADLRRGVIVIRDGPLWSLHDGLTITIAQVRSQLVVEDLASRDIDDLTAYLSDYQIAIDTTAYATMSFLATGQTKFAGMAQDAMATAASRMADLNAGHEGEFTRHSLAALESDRQQFAAAAASLLASDARMEQAIAEEVEPANTGLTASLRAAAQTLDTVVTAAYAAEARARTKLLARNVYLTSIAFVLLIGTNVLVLWNVIRPIRALTRTMQAMAKGDVAAPLDHGRRHDEIGLMMAALETLRRAVHDAFIRGQIISQLPIGVICAERRERLVLSFINPEAQRLLNAAGLADEALIGQSLDFLGSAKLPANPADWTALPCTERISLGDEAFDLGISAVLDASGVHTSAMLTLAPRSDQMRLLTRFESSIATFAESLSRSSISVRDTAAGMQQAAAEGLQRTTTVVAATGEASAQVREIATVADRLMVSVGDIGKQIQTSVATASQAAREASLADGSVDQLGDAADRIGGIVRLIGEVAARTKMLALNATIEAARAGESGRGFAVVASEVKALAAQTAAATLDVGTQVTAMQATARQTMGVLNGVAGAIRLMSDIATGILAKVAEQQDALRAIVDSVREVAIGTQNVTQDLGGVQQIVSHTGIKAREVLEATTSLSCEAESLTVEATVFLGAIQAVS